MTRYTPLWLQPGSYPASLDRRLIAALWPGPASSGGAVTVASAMTLNVAALTAAVPSPNSSGSTLCYSDATEQVTLPAAPASGSNRIDLVTVHPRGNDLDGGVNNDWIVDSVQGAVAASPAVPATPAGQLALAQIYIPGGSAAVTAGNITDVRPGGLAVPPLSGVGSPPRGWVASVVGPASQINAGATQTTVLQLTAPLVAGRRYRVTVQVLASQQGASGQPQSIFNDSTGYIPAGIIRPFWIGATIVATMAAPGNGVWTFVATNTANDTFTLTAASNAGTCQVGANAAQISLEDIGAQ